jgi:aminotransferase
MPKGAFYVFPDISSSGLDGEEFAMKLLKEQKVAVVPGNAFGSGVDKFVRLSYATSLDKIKIAVSRMKELAR